MITDSLTELGYGLYYSMLVNCDLGYMPSIEEADCMIEQRIAEINSLA